MKQLKRLASVLLVLGIVLGLMPLSAFAAKPENTAETTFTVTESDNGGVDTYTFTLLDDGTVELTAFSTTASAANAVIPSTAQGHSVTSIGDGAFGHHDELKTVKLPDSITSIGDAAFLCCYNLTTVDLGNLVESIGVNAFAYCTSMERLTIPQSIKEIKAGAFYYGYQVTKHLDKLHYTGTKAQWNELVKKYNNTVSINGFYSDNNMLHEPKEFHCAHTVSFDYCDPAKETSQVVQKEVQYGETVPRPADPTAQHYRFEGWHTEKNDDTPFDFNQKITEDVTLYAHWSMVESTRYPDTDEGYLTDEEYTLTAKDGSLVCVTVVENGTTVDITKNVGMKKQGTTQIGKIPAGAMVTVAANAAPEGMVFAQWNISDPALMGDPDVAHTNQTMIFSMPAADVTIEAMYESAENARETELLGSAAMIGAVGISAVVLAYQAHQLGTELYLKYLLPSGAALPQNRIQLAELLWRNAGEPVPDANAAYEDIGLNDEAAQQAAQWVLENELMELPDEEHTGQFKPDERISYGEAIRAWKKAQQLKTAE